MILYLVCFLTIKTYNLNKILNSKIDGINLIGKSIDFLLKDMNFAFSFEKYKTNLKNELTNLSMTEGKCMQELLNSDKSLIQDILLNDLKSFFLNEFIYDENEYEKILYDIDNDYDYNNKCNFFEDQLLKIIDLFMLDDYVNLQKKFLLFNQNFMPILDEIRLHIQNNMYFYNNACFYCYLYYFKDYQSDKSILMQIISKYCKNINLAFIEKNIKNFSFENLTTDLFLCTFFENINYNFNETFLNSFSSKIYSLNRTLILINHKNKIIIELLKEITNVKNPSKFTINKFEEVFSNFSGNLFYSFRDIFKFYHTFKKKSNFEFIIQKKIKSVIKNIEKVKYPYNYIINLCKSSLNINEIIESEEFRDSFSQYFKTNNEFKIQLFKDKIIRRIFELRNFIRVFLMINMIMN